MKRNSLTLRFIVMPLLFLITVVSVLELGVPLAQTQEDGSVIEVVESLGSVNWSNGVIRAVGLGVPPTDSVNARHGREMAKRAARVVAYRNLLEIVQGIRVDSQTLVKNYMVENDEINTKVQGIIKGARVTNQQEFPDGSVEVTVEMGLNTELARVIPQQPKKPMQMPIIQGQSSSDEGIYTGLVVDAQRMSVQTALSPRILMEDGQVLYSSDWVDKDIVQDKGLVGWKRGIDGAEQHERVTASPLMVTALRVNGPDLVISDADAQTLYAVPEHIKFLKKGKVLIVLDQ